MEVVIALVIAIAFSLACAGAVKKLPWAFYVGAIALDVLFLSQAFQDISPVAARVVHPYFSRCLIAYGLFAVVMLIGALPQHSALRRRLAPVRGELSIIAAILTIGHVANYAQTYLHIALSGFVGMKASMIASFAIALVLVILLTALTVTSFEKVRRSMDATKWKALQRWAYAFFGLILVHIALVLGPTISSIDQRAFWSLMAYAVITLIYALLRLTKAFKERKHAEDAA